MDFISKKKRSFIMSKIRSKNTRPEIVLRTMLRSMKIKYRLDSKLAGKPDIKIVGQKLVIFVDGCFWHGCPKHYKKPTSNSKFWKTKVLTNRKRDRRVQRLLESQGYTVLRLWEHELLDEVNVKAKIRNLLGLNTIFENAA